MVVRGRRSLSALQLLGVGLAKRGGESATAPRSLFQKRIPIVQNDSIQTERSRYSVFDLLASCLRYQIWEGRVMGHAVLTVTLRMDTRRGSSLPCRYIRFGCFSGSVCELLQANKQSI
ncbi:hypothetical protein SAICODRAFT_206590 [Saitoella complicata NRRL Y-17804]|uniref:uncharacterized protein n=1 Tax=Saitoella complicata (strain BCRC 22490 / CBS 7301 / JCM 7358 / NBRC 10748 / NRRL Y-17804) TaxID=698492 RepID=UPI0008674DC7|nr:uncharacterized protein SAICODRAFT_206590 [Saitoella complicata NRRL Y-17804]ODQ54832.1 hypothetical protein SAICODRAFT_206590 [Saitoella complicata NRRL Y-17804]